MAIQSGFVKKIRDIMRMDAGINGDAQRIEQMVWMLFLKVYDAKEDDWELNEDDYESIIPEECRWRNWAKADSNGHALTGDKLLDFINNTLFPILKGNDIKDGAGNVILKGIVVTPDTPVKKAIVKSTFEDANNYMKDGVYLRQVIDIIDEIEFDDVAESHAFGFVYEEILRDLQSAGSSGEFYTPRAVTEFMATIIKPQIGEKMADFACGTGGFITSWLGQLQKEVSDIEGQKKLEESIYGIEKKPFPYLLCVTNMLLHDIEVPNIFHQNSLKHNLLDYTDDDKFDVILMNPPYGGHEDKSIQSFFPDDLASSETSDLFVAVIMQRLKKTGRAAVVLPEGFLTGIDVSAKVELKKKLLSEFNLTTIVKLPNTTFAPYAKVATNILFIEAGHKTDEIWIYEHKVPKGQKHYSKTKPIQFSEFSNEIDWWNNRKENEYAWKVSISDIIAAGYKMDFKNPSAKDDDIEITVDEAVSEIEESYEHIAQLYGEIKNKYTHDITFKKYLISDICDVVKGKSPIKKTVPGEYPMVVTAEDRQSAEEYQFDCEAVCIPLVSSSGHGHASMKRVHYQEGKFALGNILCALIPYDNNVVLAKYLYIYFSQYKDTVLVPLMKGTTNVSLNMKDIKNVSIDIPDIEYQQYVISQVEHIESIEEKKAEIAELEEALKKVSITGMLNF